MITRWLARGRVGLGFVFAAIVLWLATPTALSWAAGASIAALGEAVRLWAAGHVEKSREVTRSGPYRLTRHPLYLGSTLIGVGLVVVANHAVVALLVACYLAATLTAAMRSEEAHLREKFGDAYAAYAERRAEPMDRDFSWARARRNREHHTIVGLVLGLVALAIKAAFAA